MITKYNDKMAKIISDALNMVKGEEEIVRYAKIMTYIKGLEQEYFDEQSPLNIDTIFELLTKYCDDFIVENFCARAVYFGKAGKSQHHDNEIQQIGEKRLIQLYSIIKNNGERAAEEYQRLCTNDKDYIQLIRDYKAAKDAKKDVKLINYALREKEKCFDKFSSHKITATNCLCEILTGKNIKDISGEVVQNIVKNVQAICDSFSNVK